MDSVTSHLGIAQCRSRFRARSEKERLQTGPVQGARSSALNACKFLVDSGKLFSAVALSRDGIHISAVLTDRSSARQRRRALCNVFPYACACAHRLAYVSIRINAYQYACNVKGYDVESTIYTYVQCSRRERREEGGGENLRVPHMRSY